MGRGFAPRPIVFVGKLLREGFGEVSRSWPGNLCRTVFGRVPKLEAVSSPMLEPSVGLGVLHLFLSLEKGADREAYLQAVKSAEEDGCQVITVAMLGHRADVGVMALAKDFWRLRRLQGELRQAGLIPRYSYVSLTEVSEYAGNMSEGRRNARLYPVLPPRGKTAFCFYPMSKRRSAADNWYMLPYERRLALMHEHGTSGRRFAGRVVQLVTGSAGLDDYEWGVTLFAVAPDDLKEVVYEMRFDEVSARYGEFGPFLSGMIASPEEVWDGLGMGQW